MKSIFKKPIILHTAIIIFALLISVGTLYYQFQKNPKTPTKITKGLDGEIEKLNNAIEVDPHNIQNYISLSQAYLQKVRETADVALYEKVEVAMKKAEKIDPNNSDIFGTKANIEIGRHHFSEGKAHIEKAISRNPNNYLYYGSLGDAEIELGQYEEAVKSFQKMVDLRPNYAGYVRIAYIRELYGDIKGAKEALDSAIQSGSNFKENIAFAYVELGKLNARDEVGLAEQNFNAALRLVPEYPPALEGLGKISFFKQDYATSEDYFMRAYQKLSIAQYATDLADLYSQSGREDEEKKYLKLAQLAYSNSSSSGVNTDLEESLFLNDHNIDVGEALAKATHAYKERPSIYAADYLSWALYKNNQAEKAAIYAKDAFKLGETDPLILFHQGMIAYKNANIVQAKKYLLASRKHNQYFSMLDKKILDDTLSKITK